MLNELRSEKTDQILKALLDARAEMGVVTKDASNPMYAKNGKKSYATINAYIDSCEEPLQKHGMILDHAITGSYKEPFLITTITHIESGQWIRSCAPMINEKNNCQGQGASVTYNRRYNMAALLNLVADDDDGNAACEKPKKTQSKVPPLNYNVTSDGDIQLIDENDLIEFKRLKSQVSDKYRARLEEMLEDEGIADDSKIPKELFLTQRELMKANIEKYGNKNAA